VQSPLYFSHYRVIYGMARAKYIRKLLYLQVGGVFIIGYNRRFGYSCLNDAP